MRLGRVVERAHEGVPLELLLHDAALHAVAAAVDQPHFAQAGGVGGGQVLVDDRADVARVEGVEIERGFDRNFGAIAPLGLASRYFTVTIVVMPPRAEKSPTTVMRRGAQAATRSSRI